VSDVANPLIAERLDSTRAFSGIFIAEDIDALIAGYTGGGWIDTAIGGFATSMDTLAAVTDPLGQLAAWGVGWLIEHVKPLSDALDELAGDPGQIAAYAQTWRNVATAVTGAGGDLSDAIGRQVADWTGTASDAYRHHAGEHQAVLAALARAGDAMAEITAGAGLLVAMVRALVRDLIAEFVSVLAVRLWEWLAEAGLTLGLATPWVITQVTALAGKWVARIARVLNGLIASLRRLVPMLRRLDDLIRSLQDLLRRLARRQGGATPSVRTAAPRSFTLHSRSGALSNREVIEQGIGLPRTPETVEHYARLAGVDLRGANVDIVDGADDVAYLDYQGAVARTDDLGVQLGPAAFQDEETLVRTLGHESVHVRQYEDGRVTTSTGPLEDEAYSAEDACVQNWRNQR
jgi:hypothetical protein